MQQSAIMKADWYKDGLKKYVLIVRGATRTIWELDDGHTELRIIDRLLSKARREGKYLKREEIHVLTIKD